MYNRYFEDNLKSIEDLDNFLNQSNFDETLLFLNTISTRFKDILDYICHKEDVEYGFDVDMRDIIKNGPAVVRTFMQGFNEDEIELLCRFSNTRTNGFEEMPSKETCKTLIKKVKMFIIRTDGLYSII